MGELLKTLYWNLYTPYENQETEQELDDCYKQLIEVLGKPESKLVLRIIDGKDRLADEILAQRTKTSGTVTVSKLNTLCRLPICGAVS